MSKKSKKQGAKEELFALGRPGNNVKMGIVGLPNVGKSMLFNILSGLTVPSENYPFCTIDPAVAKVGLEDERFDFLCDTYKPASKVKAAITVTDIAGLVKGAAEGHGLGNAFLSHIAAVDAIFHVVRAFKGKHIEHVEGEVDPVRDLDIIAAELRCKDIERMKKVVEDYEGKAKRSKDKRPKDELAVVQKVQAHLESGKDVRLGIWNNLEIEVINSILLLSAKPVIFLVNVSKKNWADGGNKWIKPLKEWISVNSPSSPMIPFSAAFERDVADAEDKAKFLKEAGRPSMVDKILWTGYRALGLIHFFTAGHDEVRAWTLKKTTKSKQAAGVIHTDFERCFISSECMAFEDFKEHGSEQAVKSAGRFRTEGKDYVVKDGDILVFKHNAGGSGKK